MEINPVIDCISCTVPTGNPEVCDFCQDYVPPAESLYVDEPCWLVATGDSTKVEIYRSPLVKRDDESTSPALDFIETHGLKLVFTETDEDSAWMFGERIREIYA
jgi:hypothetical protein